MDLGQILLHLPVLKEFHLVSCQLNNTSIYTLLKLIESENNQTMTRHGHYYLQILDLSHNNLTRICHRLFDGLYNLHELRLEHNFIRLIDNNFLQSFQQIQHLNLAHNSIEFVPKLSSRTLQILNYSSNQIHYLTDYFAANLPSIRSIDFDYNSHLNNTSLRAFCFLNLQTLEKLTFRSNKLYSLNSFGELLCRLENQTFRTNLIDINNNTHLKCNCTLVQFEKYLHQYQALTCTQHTQDLYFISKLTDWREHCSADFCFHREKQIHGELCNWIDAERAVYEGTCEAKLHLSEEKKKHRTKLTSTVSTSINRQLSDNNTSIVENSTISNADFIQMNISILIISFSISLLF